MILKRTTLLAVVLGGVALVAGCGSSSSTSSSQTNPPTTVAKLPSGQQAVELCKHAIQQLSSISASAKARLEPSCGKAASGTQASQQQITKDVCVELVNASHIPAGAARERALTVCKAP